MLQQWNVEFAKDLTSINGRILPAEKIFQKDGAVRTVFVCCSVCELVCVKQLSYDPTAADWGRGMRGNTLISAVGLQVCVCLHNLYLCVGLKHFTDRA